jgi:hypothetical protein
MSIREKYLDEGSEDDLLKPWEIVVLTNKLKGAGDLLFSGDLSQIPPDRFNSLKNALKRIKKEIETFNGLVIKAHIRK